MHISNKTILITGASKGIGKTLALELAKISCNLALIARSEKELKEVQNQVLQLGSKCEIFVGDISHSDFVETLVSEAIESFGTIDFLVNNAGVGDFGPIENYSEASFDKMFDTNMKGTFLLSKNVIPVLKTQKRGHIVTIISDVGKRDIANGALYCASKFAQDAFTSAMRKELRPFNIKVSNIYSGLVDSEFHEGEQGSLEHELWLKTQDMAKSIIFVMNQAEHVVIDELMIHPISQEY